MMISLSTHTRVFCVALRSDAAFDGGDAQFKEGGIGADVLRANAVTIACPAVLCMYWAGHDRSTAEHFGRITF